MFSRFRTRPFTSREKRLIVLLLVAVGLAAWKYVPRPWHPSAKVETARYVILSTAAPAQTEEIARVVEALYGVYSNRFGALPTFRCQHAKLQMKLYKDRREFRRVNPGLGWAEAFYRKPYCQAYYSSQEINSHHWMLHEATHQLNAEVAHVTMAQWLEEGLAEYFSTSRFLKGQLVLGTIDPNTYPVWWIDDLATTPDLTANLQNGSVIPLRAIVTGHGGPSMNRHFNLYYLHWWSLTHFLFQTERHRPAVTALLEQGGGLETFEKRIGPVDTVQAEWHDYVRHLKAVLAGHDPQFLRTGQVPPMTNAPGRR
jgi:hypothetical protein